MGTISRRDMLVSSVALAAGTGLRAARAQAEETAALALQAFGGDAELGAITNAVNRFKANHPKASVDIAIDPISTGWGDYVTKVLGQFNAGSAADVYGTAIETFRGFPSHGLWLPLDDFVSANPGFSDFAPTLFQEVRLYLGSRSHEASADE